MSSHDPTLVMIVNGTDRHRLKGVVVLAAADLTLRGAPLGGCIEGAFY